ncbi:MAG: hypothetical protein QM729_21490 [Solirubrobacterales bacterium]
MKNFKLLAFGLTVIALASFAALEPIVDRNSSIRPLWLQSGLYIGPTANPDSLNTTNKVTRLLGASTTFDFPSQTITCSDSTSITVLGAQVNDPCFTSMPSTPAANAIFTCYVNAANSVVVRFCAAGTATDPASALYSVRVISNQ